jgi:hypothetical protein
MLPSPSLLHYNKTKKEDDDNNVVAFFATLQRNEKRRHKRKELTLSLHFGSCMGLVLGASELQV